ncbi:alanine--tRNA ligase [Candidatus Beckwithbacteria bacterium]|nr:alanine--tRNA ligase [Candidatus Beckwithbacteria bacterium]
MNADQVRSSYLDFFKSQGHVIVPSTSLVPQNDPTTLFTGSGMQPMIPYFFGQTHPLGVRITNSQRCFRSQDIEAVGDNRHTTFFEMLGNWSFGDYFKTQQLPWFWQFLTQTIGLDPKRLYVTVFAGDSKINIPQDDESVEIWQKLFSETGIKAKAVSDAAQSGMADGRIFFYGNNNWWSRSGKPNEMPAGEPGGPDSEVFYDFDPEGKLGLHQNSPFKDQSCHVNCDCGRFLEIGNSVFMQYQKQEDGSFKPLPKKNVDFGGGLERIVAAAQDQIDIFKTDLFWPVITKIETLTSQKYDQHPASYRVIADHIRGAVMLAWDGVEPSNKQQGYFARRLLRRAMRHAKMIGINQAFLGELVPIVAQIYQKPYPELLKKQDQIKQIIEDEESRFAKTLDKGLKELDKLIEAKELNGDKAFYLYETFGFPFEITKELAAEKGIVLQENDFMIAKTTHAEASRTASKGMFKGGLADQSETITKLHTTTHLLHQALRQVLGDHVSQVGSNITAERLRFDFTHQEKLTDEQMTQVEQIVNEQIEKDLPVTVETMTPEEAKKSGALAFFADRYGEKVKVYSVGDSSTGSGQLFSKEICGGPHVAHTGVLGKFELFKQEAVGAGKRRVYGRLI